MVFIPRKKVKKKRYYRYKEAKKLIPTKAELLRRALKKAKEIEYHAEWIDFIPAKFSLQLHGWISKDSEMKKLSDVQKVVKSALKRGKDPLKVVDKKKAKCHYDLRVQKLTAPTWFGITLFRAPWTGTAENKVQGTVKGYQSLVPGGKKLAVFLEKRAQKMMATEGIRERQDRIEWMKVKAQWFLPNSPGNPTKDLPAFMIALEFYKPAVLHRRQFDFIDFTFLGDKLKGRYYYRLVERKLSEDELTEYQKKDIKEGKAKAYYGLFFYLWKAKKQFDPKEMRLVALLKKKKDPIPAPPSKKKA